jgi:peptidoglycan hydrolase CwlO-like protein
MRADAEISQPDYGIARLEKKIDETEGEIRKVQGKIDELEADLKQEGLSNIAISEHPAVMELRAEKNKLLDKENKLLDEKKLLLEKEPRLEGGAGIKVVRRPARPAPAPAHPSARLTRLAALSHGPRSPFSPG